MALPGPHTVPGDAAPRERSDSRRKRLRLIDAARQVVAEKGLDAGAAEIAARAEVGVGTLYRRFGSREALVQDIISDGMVEVQAAASQALAEPDPWTGLANFLTAFSMAQAANRGLAEFTADSTSGLAAQLLEQRETLRRTIQVITERAHEAGVLRPDVSWRDIVVLSHASARTQGCLGVRESDPQRTAAILLEGLRAPGVTPLPGRPPVDEPSEA